MLGILLYVLVESAPQLVVLAASFVLAGAKHAQALASCNSGGAALLFLHVDELCSANYFSLPDHQIQFDRDWSAAA